jgi:hypothetical protein
MLVWILLSVLAIAVVGLGVALFMISGQLRETRQRMEELQQRLTDLKPVGNSMPLTELEKILNELKEKEDNEFNSLWAEFESLRAELLAKCQPGITSDQWRLLLQERIPAYTQIRTQVNALMSANAELAQQLQETLPAYLIDDRMLPGMIDLARYPFDRVNWMDALILPVSARLDGPEDGAALAAPFQALLDALGYSSILPINGEVYHPDQHEVVEQRISAAQRGTVLATRARGYSQQGAILRKAKVVISAGQN